MSLTSELKNPESIVYHFMRERFPHMRSVVRGVNVELNKANIIRPEEAVDWGTVGAAFDHRIRFYFGHTHRESVTIQRGARILEGSSLHEETLKPISATLGFGKQQVILGSVVSQFFRELEVTLSRLQPKRASLERVDEELLCRYCVILALFEQIGRLIFTPQTLLVKPAPAESVQELLSRIPDSWVEDMRDLSWAFFVSQGERFLKDTQDVALGPTFDGSHDVGGADADLILDGLLMEVKTSTKPKIKADMVYQLLGYVLLDYSDKYKIRSVAIYMARQMHLVHWELSELLSRLGCEDNTQKLRTSFYKAL